MQDKVLTANNDFALVCRLFLIHPTGLPEFPDSGMDFRIFSGHRYAPF
jgi:hypothetical protein